MSLNIHSTHGPLSHTSGNAEIIGGRSSYVDFHHAMKSGKPIGTLTGNQQAGNSFDGSGAAQLRGPVNHPHHPAHHPWNPETNLPGRSSIVALQNVRVKHIKPVGNGLFHYDINY